jgi:transcriptional regulator with XRE-family HTH domain
MKVIIDFINLPRELYVEIRKEDHEKLWQSVSSMSIKEVAEKIGVNVRNLYKYKEGNSGYPVNVLKRLINLTGITPEVTIIKTRRDSESIECKLPIYLDENFAEFLGYILGDGGIDSQLGVHFTTNRIEVLKRFIELVQQIFGNMKFQLKNYTTRYTVYYPKTLGVLLTQVVGLPRGSKVDSEAAIPDTLLNNFDISMKIKFIRAFYECDGFSKEIGIGQAGKDLDKPPKILIQIKTFLEDLGFTSVYLKKSTNYLTPKTKKLRSRWVLRIKSKEEKKKFVLLISPLKFKDCVDD